MNKHKIYDCITFYDENLITNARFEILKNVVDYFVICESNYDHKGRKKKINFKLLNQKFNNKVRHIILKKNFLNLEDGWEVERFQREQLFQGIIDANENDFIMYSDSDEIPNPIILKNLKLKKKYGIFLQNFFVYKLNIFNNYESPWEGTRICKKKDLKSFSYLRKKILRKNLKKNFLNFSIEKNIQIFDNGGWHFNNLYTPKGISKKLKTFQHKEFSAEKFSSVQIIKEKILNLQDLFERGHTYKVVNLKKFAPEYILKNKKKFLDWIV